MTVDKVKIDKVKLEQAAYVFKAVAHPVRLAVINLLDENGRMTVNELCAKTNCEQSLLSHHLATMKQKGLLSSERQGQNIFYSLKESHLTQMMGCLDKCALTAQN